MSAPVDDRELRLAKLLHRLDESSDGNLISDKLLITEEMEHLSIDQIQKLRDAKDCLLYLDQIRQLEQGSTDGQAVQTAAERVETSLPFSPKPPNQIGRYEIRELIGQGGFAKVYRAFDPVLDRDVALKIPRPEVFVSAENRKRFRREARAAATLAHPSIVSVFDAGADGAYEFISFDFCEGETLSSIISQANSLPPVVVARTVSQLALALEHAHSRNLFHRDIKPGNILVDASVYDPGNPESLADAVRIADFGLVKYGSESGGEQTLTLDGAIVGTPAFMSPEQVRGGGTVGPQSDIFSLGNVMYLLLTGAFAHKCDSHFDTFKHITDSPPKPLRSIDASISKDLESVCLKCLNKSPDARYLNAAELSEDLERWLAGQPVRARRPSNIERLKLWCLRNRIAAASLLVAFVTLVAGTSFSTMKWFEAEHERSVSTTALRIAEEKTKTTEDVLKTFMMAYEELDPRKTKKPNPPLAEDVLFIVRKHVSNELDDDDPAKARLLEMLANCFDAIGKYEACAECRLKQVAVTKRVAGEDSPELLAARNTLAKAQYQAGKFRDAAGTQRDAVEQLKLHTEPNRGNLLLAKSLLAFYETLSGDELTEDAIAIFAESEGLLTEDTATLAKVAETTAQCLYRDRKYRGIVDLFAPRIASLEEQLGKTHLTLAKLKRWMARAHSKLKQFDSAIELQENVIWIRQQNDYGTLEDSKVLASILRASNKTENVIRAIELLKDSVSEAVEVFGQAHPIPITSQQEVAKLYIHIGEYQQAIDVLELTLESCVRKLEKDSGYTAQVMFDLAKARQMNGDFKLALPLVETAVAINRKRENVPPKTEERNLRNLARACVLCEDPRSEEFYEALIQFQKSRRGNADAATTAELALLRYSQRNFESGFESIDSISKEDRNAWRVRLLHNAAALELGREPTCPFDSADNEALKSNPFWHQILQTSIAVGLVNEGKFLEAEEVLVAAHKAINESFDRPEYNRFWGVRRDNQFLLSKVAKQLVRVYEATGDSEKIELWKAAINDTKP